MLAIAFRSVRYVIFLILCIVLMAILLPRQYGTPELSVRIGTKYWDLKTGSRIAYTHLPARGNGKPFPVIYLHGGPGGTIGERNIEILKPLSEAGYDVYLYDQVGGGFSCRLERITDYTADRHKRDLEEIVNRIGAAKVILLGQSWGAILAVLYLADNPNRVAKMILTGPGPIMPARQDLVNVLAPDSLKLREPYYSNRQGNEKTNNIRTRMMALIAIKFGKKLASDQEADDFAGYLNQAVDRSTVCDTGHIHLLKRSRSGFYAQVMTSASFGDVVDPRPKIKNSPVPVLVLKGQCDNQRWGFTREYLDLFPRHRLILVPDAGHAISLEQPALYQRSILDFLLSFPSGF